MGKILLLLFLLMLGSFALVFIQGNNESFKAKTRENRD
jgi:hypothetical protein